MMISRLEKAAFTIEQNMLDLFTSKDIGDIANTRPLTMLVSVKNRLTELRMRYPKLTHESRLSFIYDKFIMCLVDNVKKVHLSANHGRALDEQTQAVIRDLGIKSIGQGSN